MNMKEAFIVSIAFFGTCSLLVIWSLLVITYWREWQAKRNAPPPAPKKKKRRRKKKATPKKKRIAKDEYDEDDDIIIEE